MDLEIKGYRDKHEIVSKTGMRSVIYLMDCMDALKQIPPRYFDLAVVDPPYGINAPNERMGTHPTRSGKNQYPAESTATRLKRGRLNQGGGAMKNSTLVNSDCSWDDAPPSEDYFLNIMTTSKNQIIWGANYFPLPPTRCMLCWDKKQPWDNFSQFELAWTSFNRPAAMYRRSNTGGLNHEKKIHPTQKPVKLYEWILRKFANHKDKIIDTHLGSGSSRIAAYKANMHFVGFEIDPEYFRSSIQRFNNEIEQLSLFEFTQN